MADIELIKPRELPEQAQVFASDAIMVDNGTIVGKATPEKVVNAGAPVATEAEALAGVNNTKRMTPLRTKQVLDNLSAPAIVRAQAWAESPTAPDPLMPDSRSSKTWAGVAKEYADKAEQGTVMVQWSCIAEDGQTVLGDDVTTGEPIRAYGGVAQISVNGFGPLTAAEYSVASDGVITLTTPLAEGDVVSGFTQPRLTNSDAQAVVQGVLQQTSDDVRAAQEAADAAAASAALVKPQFDSVAQLQADTAMTDATVPVGGTVSVNGVGGYVRVASGGDIITAGGMAFDVDTSSGFLKASMLNPSAGVVGMINAAFQKCKGTSVTVDASGFGDITSDDAVVFVRGVSANFDGTRLFYTNSYTGSSAVYYDVSGEKSPTTIDKLSIFGPDFGGEWVSTAVDGLDFSGATASGTLTEITFNNAHIEGFRHARVYGSNVYINSFKSCHIMRNYSSFYCPSGMTNVGEKTLDIDCLIAENQWADIVYSAVDRDLIGCSVDYHRVGDFDYSNDNSGRMKMQGGNYEFGTHWVVGPRIKTPSNELQGAQRSGFVEFSRVRMQVRDPSDWPSGVPLATGAGDVVFTKSHIWGVGRDDEPLMTGGGRIERDRCTYSRVPNQSWDSGRALNINGGFESDTPLVDIGFWVEGGGNTGPSSASNLTITRSADLPRTGAYSAKITPLFGAGSPKEVWYCMPISWGELPFIRYYIRPTVTPSSNMFTDIYYGVSLGFDANGVPKFGQKTSIGTQSFIPTSGTWTKRVFSLSTPENLTAPKWATHVLVRISMNAASNADGPVYIDDWYFDTASGRKR